MIKKHDSELHSWLFTPSTAAAVPLPRRTVEVGAANERPAVGGGLFGADDWIDELEMLDAILEDE